MFIICFLLVFSGSLMLQMLSFVVSRFTFSVFFLCTNCWPRIPLGSNQMAVANAAANVGQVFFLFRDSGVLKHVVYLSHPSFDSWNRCSFFSEHSLCCTLCPFMTSWSISQHKIIVTVFFFFFFGRLAHRDDFVPLVSVVSKRDAHYWIFVYFFPALFVRYICTYLFPPNCKERPLLQWSQRITLNKLIKFTGQNKTVSGSSYWQKCSFWADILLWRPLIGH